MLRKLNFLLVSILLTMSYSYGQTGLGSIKGTVVDKENGEPCVSAQIILRQNDIQKAATKTNYDGEFLINSIEAGSYDIEIRLTNEGYQPKRISGYVVKSDQINFLEATLSKSLELEEVEVVVYKVPLIDKDGGASGATVTREDIARLPVRSAAAVAGTVGGVNQSEGSGAISVRGSRSDATYFYIDGIKVRGSSSLPKSAIEEVKVITGGLPANYGDATGGIISVTTRGPSAQYFGSIEGVTSGFYFNGADPDGYDGKVFGLDKYGYNLVEGMFSGPLWMEKDSAGNIVRPRIGFLVSGNMTDQVDGRPLAGGSYRVKKDVRDSLLAAPLRPTPSGIGTYYNANFLRMDDFENVPWRMNARGTNISGQAKIDVNTGPNMNLTFGGSMNYAFGSSYSRAQSLLNFSNFGAYTSLDWRVFGRLTQRFQGSNEEGASSKIKSAFYSLMVDFSQSKDESYDPKHGFNLFNYGHVGTFVTTRRPSYGLNPETQMYEHNGFKDVLVEFTPSETNSALAAVTSQYYNIFDNDPIGHYENLTQIQQGNGLRNGDSPSNVYALWYNLGTPYNGFGRSQADQFRVTGSGSVNIGDHSISLGFEYEKRTDRGWTSGDNGPISIWQLARQLMNFHIKELDPTTGVIIDSNDFNYVTYDRYNSGYAYQSGTGLYGGAQNGDNQSFFDYNLRKYLYENNYISQGGDGTEFIDIDMYDPNIYNFGMFSPDELLNSGSSYVSYWGYDHAGNKVKGQTDIDKYFTEFDDNGNYRRFVGAFQPIYMAGYIMDKFAFRDIVFNVGVRVDIFDANQPVLKDPYLLYTARTVSEAKAELSGDPTTYAWVDIPDAMGDDYVVYVNDVDNPTAINGFRNGSVWYDANGIETEDPSSVRGPEGIAPWLHDPSLNSPTSDAFEDYKPQINVMPRIAFSFPISDEASFFAHYDILTKRPTTGYRFNPYEYQFLNSRNSTINNPNLKPETTIDYELGFQQVLTKTSSLKISAFYREQRNNVQLMNIFEAYPNTYSTFGNRDFGTVKGVTIAYDLRRTGNVRMTANYTLQFAEGTGSDATSAAGLINAGLPNLRAIFPYSYDQRHAFAITFDYRYGEGPQYKGPSIGDFGIFENTGLNIVSNIYSGSPYSRQVNITNAASFSPQNSGLLGTTNGSRLPWSYRLDLQIDRTFNIEFGKEDKKKASFLNVYVRVTNLFNQFNVLGVYRATGNPDDDGYLAAAESQAAIQSQLDSQSYIDYYMLKVQNPYNISAPRTIRLGVKFDF